MRTLARNMEFLIKSIALGKETFGLPEKEAWFTRSIPVSVANTLHKSPPSGCFRERGL